jgi:2-aminoadipate transaminase
MSTISFARGIPAPECLPVSELADCARSVLERDGHTVLSYGPSPGYGPLVEWLAERHDADPSRIFVTNGSLQGLVFLCQRLAAGRRVLVERPTYDRPLKILRELGSQIVPVQCDDEGLDPDALERELEAGEAAFVYLIPTFQNPSGRTLGLERRQRVVELAERHGVLVLEDDPYGLVRFEGEPLPSLFELSGGQTAYSSSFSKTIAPGLRVGWFVLPDVLAAEIVATATGTYITPVLLGQATVHEFVSRGLFEPNLERVRGLLGARRDAMLAALDDQLGHLPHSHPEGGYFVWLELEGVDAGELLGRAEAAGVTFVKGADFGADPDSLRLAYSYVSPAAIGEGVTRLASVLAGAPVSA